MPLFTADQANATLPLVRRIVEDIVREHRRRGEKLVEMDLRTGAASDAAPDADLADLAGLATLEREIRAIGRELEGFERELRDLGVQLKDPRIGLVDFPGQLDGRRVLLCWHLGEPSVQFWHDESSGFAGRRPLAPTLVG